LSPRCVQWQGMCRSKTSGKPIFTICPMSRATSSTRSVIITKSLWPRISLACCASCTLMTPSSPKLELLGREHSNCTSWAQRTVDPTLRPPEIKLLDFLYGEWGVYNSPFAPSGSLCLNFKLCIESNPQSQPLEDVFL